MDTGRQSKPKFPGTADYGHDVAADATTTTATTTTTTAAIPPARPPPPEMCSRISKWLDGHTAAVSITYDARPDPSGEPDVAGYVMENGMVIDYEIITGNTRRGDPVYSGPGDKGLAHMLHDLVPRGFGYFGHGHNHVDHDALSYLDAADSFRRCFNTMNDWGLRPVAYAYPRNAGTKKRTQKALEESGFLCGRLQARSGKLCSILGLLVGMLPAGTAGTAKGGPAGHGGRGRGGGPVPGRRGTLRNVAERLVMRMCPGARHPIKSGTCYNIAGDMRAPANWFGLCALPMQSLDFKAGGVTPCYSCINCNDDLLPVLDGALKRTAWIILTYHNIGRPKTYGWYDWGEFQKDIRSIAARDFWVASMNEITLYAREREAATLRVETFGDPGMERIRITLSCSLDPAVFDRPLTVMFRQPADWKGVPLVLSQDGRPLGEFTFDGEDVSLSLRPSGLPYVLATHT